MLWNIFLCQFINLPLINYLFFLCWLLSNDLCLLTAHQSAGTSQSQSLQVLSVSGWSQSLSDWGQNSSRPWSLLEGHTVGWLGWLVSSCFVFWNIFIYIFTIKKIFLLFHKKFHLPNCFLVVKTTPFLSAERLTPTVFWWIRPLNLNEFLPFKFDGSYINLN